MPLKQRDQKIYLWVRQKPIKRPYFFKTEIIDIDNQVVVLIIKKRYTVVVKSVSKSVWRWWNGDAIILEAQSSTPEMITLGDLLQHFTGH